MGMENLHQVFLLYYAFYLNFLLPGTNDVLP
jgi:hypothetical protein